MLPLLALACGSRCEPTPWEDVAIVSEVDEPGLVAEVTAVFDRFARWSGSEGTCLDEVVLEEAIRERKSTIIAGMYSGASHNLRLSAAAFSMGFDVEEIVVHELCHAVDFKERISWDRPDLFPKDTVPDHYPRRHRDEQEALALMCEMGARDVHRWALTESDCGIAYTDLPVEALLHINDIVYAGAPRFDWPDPSFDVAYHPSYASLPQVIGASSAHLIAVSGLSDEVVEVRYHDPLTGSITASDELEHCTHARGPCTLSTIQGQTGPWLYAPASGALWFLDDSGPRRIEHDCADLLEEADLLLGDTAWRLEHSLSPPGTYVGCRLSTGERVEAPLEVPDHLLEDMTQADLTGATPIGIERGPGAVWPDHGAVWLTDDGWQSAELPWYLSIAWVLPEPDGRLLLGLENKTHTDGTPLLNLARLDPATGALQASPVSCEAPGELERLYAGEGWAVLIGDDQTTPVTLTDR